MDRLTHLTEDGSAHMVDVGAKAETHRVAEARAIVHMSHEAFEAIVQGNLKKGDALGTARIAGIMAAKRTSELIPLCHPIALTKVEVTLTPTQDTITVTSRVECYGKTGVEMEALTAASVAALTVYDMAKAIDRAMVISDVQLLYKAGGKSGDYGSESRQRSAFNVFQLRPATLADVDTVTTLTNNAYEKYVSRMGRKPTPMVTDYAKMIDEAQVWLAEQQGECVGLLVLEVKDDHLLIYSIAVRPDRQHHGIGHQLMAFVEQEAVRQGFDRVRLYTNIRMTENIEIYKKIGYVETHRDEYLGLFVVHMEKRVESTKPRTSTP